MWSAEAASASARLMKKSGARSVASILTLPLAGDFVRSLALPKAYFGSVYDQNLPVTCHMRWLFWIAALGSQWHW